MTHAKIFERFCPKSKKTFFNGMPDGLKGVLSKLFGGNPFDAKANVQQQSATIGSKMNVFQEIAEKIETIVGRIQAAIRDRVLEIIGGGHRRLEDQAWGNVQDSVVNKVQQYDPTVNVRLDPPTN